MTDNLGFPHQPGEAPDDAQDAPETVEQPAKVTVPRPRAKAKPAKAK